MAKFLLAITQGYSFHHMYFEKLCWSAIGTIEGAGYMCCRLRDSIWDRIYGLFVWTSCTLPTWCRSPEVISVPLSFRRGQCSIKFRGKGTESCLFIWLPCVKDKSTSCEQLLWLFSEVYYLGNEACSSESVFHKKNVWMAEAAKGNECSCKSVLLNCHVGGEGGCWESEWEPGYSIINKDERPLAHSLDKTMKVTLVFRKKHCPTHVHNQRYYVIPKLQ